MDRTSYTKEKKRCREGKKKYIRKKGKINVDNKKETNKQRNKEKKRKKQKKEKRNVVNIQKRKKKGKKERKKKEKRKFEKVMLKMNNLRNKQWYYCREWQRKV